MSLLAELKQRRVFRAAFLYLVVAWAVIEACDIIAPRLELPEWTVTFVIVVAGLGFPIALVLAWLYDVRLDAAAGASGTAGATADGRHRQAFAYLGVGILIALVGFAAYAGYGRRDQPAAAGTETSAASIAVLPFLNMSADPEQEYFSDGLTEELLNALAQVSSLRVAARTSSFSFKGKNQPVADIARVLNVKTVLEGSVRKMGNRVRITAQLINAADGYHLWSQTYDRELTDIFAIQEEISRAITSALRLQLAAGDSASLQREQHDLSAYDLYLQARFYWNQRTESTLRQAQSLLERAIRLDPAFARAHAALADVYAVWNDYATVQDLTVYDKTTAAARRALELDSTLAEPHAALASVFYRQQFAWSDAEAAFQRSIAMRPDYGSARQWYAWVLLYTSRPDAAMAQLDQALATDPLSLIFNENKGEFLIFTGRYAEAIKQLEHTLALDSAFTVTYAAIALAYSLAGDHANAVRYADRTLTRREGGQFDLGHAAYALARAGQTDRARRILDDMERRGFWASSAHGRLAVGDTARALAALEKAHETGGGSSVVEQITVNPAVASIRSHPRVEALRRKLGLTR